MKRSVIYSKWIQSDVFQGSWKIIVLIFLCMVFTEQKDSDEIRQDVTSCEHYELLVNVNPNGLVSKDTIKYSVELKTNITTNEVQQN